MSSGKFISSIAVLLFFSIVCVLWSLCVGVYDIPFIDVLRVLFLKINPFAEGDVSEKISLVVWNIRFVRVLAAFSVGAALSLSGVVFQSVLRNPLAEPHIIGVSSGGAFGAVLAAFLGVPLISSGIFGVPLFSFFGSGLALILVCTLGRRQGILSVYSLLLIGVIINAFLVSVVIFMESLMNADELIATFHWLLGSFAYCESDVVFICSGLFLVIALFLLRYAKSLNLISLGHERAADLGVNAQRVVRVTFICAAMMTGASVALSGLIGFVGLVVPHCSRLLFGSDNRIVMPASFFMGGSFLVLSDTLARSILQPQELPVGVVTAFVGAPIFVFLLKKTEEKRLSL